MKKIATLLTIALVMMIALFISTLLVFGRPNPAKSLWELSDETIGVSSPGMLKRLENTVLGFSRTLIYPSEKDAVKALKSGKIEAYANEEPILRNLVASDYDLQLLQESVTIDSYAIAVAPGNEALAQGINDTIAELKANGIFAKMLKRWMPDKGEIGTMPDIPSGAGGTLRLATAADMKPFSFKENGAVTGLEIELAKRTAARLGVSLEIVEMKYNELLPALSDGTVDMVASGLTISPKRSEQALFSQPVYVGGIYVVQRRFKKL